MRYFIAFLILLIVSCNSSDNKTPVADSLANVDSLPEARIKKDTFQLIDELVLSIREKVKNKELTRMEGKWPGVVAYYYPDQTVAYIYSREEGELGRVETESFFINNELKFCRFRDYYFLPDSKGEIGTAPGTLKAEKVFYLPEDPLAKDSITIFNEDVKFAKKEHNVFSKEDLPTEIEIAIRVLEIKSNL